MLDIADYSILLTAILNLEERLEKSLNRLVEDYNEGFRELSEDEMDEMESDLDKARRAEKKILKMMAQYIGGRNDTMRNGAKAPH